MVRLLHALALLSANEVEPFQSHNGAIAAVRINDKTTVVIIVSIPQWCDCCGTRAVALGIREGVSIPQWCDCCPIMSSLRWTITMFQSHNGAIAASSIQHHPTNTNAFQSHNGAIAAIANKAFLAFIDEVSIPQWCDCCECGDASLCKFALKFQSHNGAIAASISGINVAYVAAFQSHNGAIAANIDGIQPKLLQSFNPTMVRLLRTPLMFTTSPNLCFNPTMVRLLLAARNHANFASYQAVSIPQWCDCCLQEVILTQGGIESFNPTMVRLLP